MRTIRSGFGKGRGKGYKNLMPFDSHVHSLSAKGIEQPFSTKRAMPPNPVEVAVIVPATLGKNKVITIPQLKKRIHYNEMKMGKLFGGYTEVDGEGEWKDPKTGRISQEPNGIIRSFTTEQRFKKEEKGFAELVRQMKKDYKQGQIAIEFKNQMYFYPEEKEK